MNPLDLKDVDFDLVRNLNKKVKSIYSIDEKWVKYITDKFDVIFLKSLIVKITNGILTYEKDFERPETIDKKPVCFILEIRSDQMSSRKIPTRHLNAVIIKNGKIYRFEPYGSLKSIDLMYNYNLVDSFMTFFFKDLIYVRPSEFQSEYGPQSLEEIVRHDLEGHCSAWSMMFLDVNLRDDGVIDITDLLEDPKSQIMAYVTFLEKL